MDLGEVIMIITIVLFFLGVLGGIAYAIVKSFKKKCPKCKTKFTYDDVIDAHVGETQVIGFLHKAYTTVHVTCQCPKCGTQKQIAVRFKSAEVTEGAFTGNLNYKEFDLDKKLKNYFK